MLKKLSKCLAVCAAAVGAFCFSYGAAFAQGLEVVKKETDGSITFQPDTLANPIIDAVIKTAKYGALIALVFIGLWIILRMFKKNG